MEDTLRLRTIPKRRIVVLAASILVFSLTLFTGFFHGFGESLQTWRGYYTLVVPAVEDIMTVQARLDEAGVTGALSAANATVDVGGWGGPVRVPVDHVSTFLLENDPRRTAYLDNAAQLFRDESSSAHVIYIPRDESLPTLMLKLHSAFQQSTTWRVLEWNPTDRIVMLVFAIVAAGLIVVGGKGFRLALFAASLPWMLLATGAGPRMFPLVVTMFLVWALLSERIIPALQGFVLDNAPTHFFWELIHKPDNAREGLKAMKSLLDYPGLFIWLVIYGAFMVLGLSVLLIGGSGEEAQGFLLIGIVAWPSIWIWAAYVFHRRRSSSEHALFSPVPILKKGTLFSTPQVKVLPFLLGIVVICMLVFALGGKSADSSRIPVPLDDAGSGSLDMNTLRAVWHKPYPNELPDMATYVAHRALQDSLAWTPLGQAVPTGFPEKDKTLEILAAPEAPGKSTQQKKVVVFNDAWLNRLKDEAPKNGLEHLYFLQGKSFGLAFSSRHGVYSADVRSLPGLVAFGSVCALLMVARRRTRFAWGVQRLFEWGKKSPA